MAGEVSLRTSFQRDLAEVFGPREAEFSPELRERLECLWELAQVAEDRAGPRTLVEAWARLDVELDPAAIESLRSGEVVPADLHNSLGMELRNTWGLWRPTSSLFHWFGRRGITDPDAISALILESYVRRLQGTAPDPEAEAEAVARKLREHEAHPTVLSKFLSTLASIQARERVSFERHEGTSSAEWPPGAGVLRVRAQAFLDGKQCDWEGALPGLNYMTPTVQLLTVMDTIETGLREIRKLAADPPDEESEW